MKIKINKNRLENIALMSVPAAMIAPISIPMMIVFAVASGSFLGIDSDDQYEFEIPESFSEWVLKDNPVYQQRILEEAQKKANVIYWAKKS